MKHKLYAFWKHDVPPYVLGGEVTEIKSNGRVCVKGFTGCSFLPLQILPLEEGRAKQKEIDLALKNYKNTIKKAEEELRSHTKQLSLKYTLTEIGHEHVNDFLKECSAKRKEILDAGIDTACQTSLPTKADILLELNDGENIGGSGEYDSDWAVTDNTAEDFAYVKCRLTYGIDYFIREDTDTDENTLLCDILQKHRGHKVSIVSYGDNDVPANIALECEDCGEVILDAGIYTICARENKNMEKEKIQFIHDSLGEAKDFSKEVKDYLYKIEKLRPLTDAEKELWNKTHRIHVRMDDSRMFIQEAYADIY